MFLFPLISIQNIQIYFYYIPSCLIPVNSLIENKFWVQINKKIHTDFFLFFIKITVVFIFILK